MLSWMLKFPSEIKERRKKKKEEKEKKEKGGVTMEFS
jgi:hypothetical protein